MIVVFTSNVDGGIVQFAIQLTTELLKNNCLCKCFIPEDAIGVIPNDVSKCVVKYQKFKTISQNDKRIYELAKAVKEYQPSFIWYVDSSILSSELCSYLANETDRDFKQLFTIHDPTQDHPTNKITLRERIKRVIVHKKRKAALGKSDNVVTLSPESGKQFLSLYPQYRNKEIVFNLGAHIPEVEELIPEECVNVNIRNYILFFGRIDKYKGIEGLLRAFENRNNMNQQLIIAGKGSFSEEEKKLIKTIDNLVILNRYIKDEEMVWLFNHAKALVLPYIEASQSGIIPIAYKFGVPVIVTNIPGLTQFVEDRSTGIICNNIAEITEAINKLDKCSEDMRSSCLSYYEAYLDWQNSLHMMFSKLNNPNEALHEG